MTDIDPAASYRKQLSSMRYWLLGRNWHDALRAFEFAQKRHDGMRKDGVSPEFSHQMFIASYARTLETTLLHPQETMSAIFLHDVCEDFDVSYRDVEALCGARTGTAVELLTKKKDGVRVPDPVYYARMAQDPIASVAKGLDRGHNIFTMDAAG